MGLKCCVRGCNATSDTHRLFSFPKNDSLRNLWMSFLVPNNPLLIGLSKEQLLRKRVCEKHFDKFQFDEEGKRLRYSYPCLFTDDELAHGEPFYSAGTVYKALSDHNYCRDEDDDADSSLVIGRAGENFHEHPSCSYSQSISSIVADQRDDISEQPSSSFTKDIEVPATSAHTVIKSESLEAKTAEDKKCSARNRQDGTVNIPGHNISIFFDPPHLLKGLRITFSTKTLFGN